MPQPALTWSWLKKQWFVFKLIFQVSAQTVPDKDGADITSLLDGSEKAAVEAGIGNVLVLVADEISDELPLLGWDVVHSKSGNGHTAIVGLDGGRLLEEPVELRWVDPVVAVDVADLGVGTRVFF